MAGGVTSDHRWDNIENAFKWASYNGLTVLRTGEVTDNPIGRTRRPAAASRPTHALFAA